MAGWKGRPVDWEIGPAISLSCYVESIGSGWKIRAMPVFAYRACDPKGGFTEGTLTADTPAAARRQLHERGARLLEFRAVDFATKRLRTAFVGRSKRRDLVAEFARQLAMLLRTDVPVAEALDVLIRQAGNRMLPIVRDIRDRIGAGMSLADALALHPGWFDGVFCSAVRVGQVSGQMDQALSELAAFMRERHNLKARLFTALAYPMLLMFVGMGVVLFLMSYVVPQLLTVLEASERSLPVSTVFLKSVSDVVTGHWLGLLVMAALVILGGSALYRWPRGRKWCHRSVLRVPVIGPLVQRAIIAQFAQTITLLLNSGVPFLECIQLLRRDTSNLALAGELEHMEESIRRGSDIAPALERSIVFPALVVHVMHVGQRSGELTGMLEQLREAYETEVRIAMGKATALLEPVLIVLMSAVVGFIVFATMMPILETTRSMQ